MKALLSLCFFLSGFSSLVLETVWSKQLSYLLGVDLFGAATAVVAYMLGLGLGAFVAARPAMLRWRDPLELYAGLQLTIGVLGLISIPTLRGTEPLFSWVYQLNNHPVLFVGVRFVVTLAILLPATTLMGMTLPVVVASLNKATSSAHRLTGTLYGINTVGAVVGTLTAGFYLIPRAGLLRTSITAGALDVLLAMVVLGYCRLRAKAQPVAIEGDQGALAPRALRLDPAICVAVCLSGVCALGLELSWFRLVVQVMGPSVNAFSITLAVFLMGIGLGSALLALLPSRRISGRHALVAALIWAVIGATIPAYFINEIPTAYLRLWGRWGAVGRDWDLIRTQAAIAALIILPATLGLGAAFPAGIWALERPQGDSMPGQTSSAARATGLLYFCNTLGSVVGTALWAFWFLPHLGARGGILMAAGAGILAIAVLLLPHLRVHRRSTWWPLLAVPLLIVLVLRVPAVDTRMQNAGFFNAVRAQRAKGKVDTKPLRKEASVLFSKEGYGASVAVIKNRYGRDSIDIAYSGKWEASTHPGSIKHLVLLGQLPMFAVPKPPRRAVVIGLGAGITTGHVLSHSSLERVDIVEIEPAVVEASRFFDSYSGRPLDDPRHRIIVQDGRTHVVFSRETYEVITSDPIHPWVKGASNLYTYEYYKSALSRLAPGGVYCQWIPSSMSRASFVSILKTMRAAFFDVKLLFSGGEAIALGAATPVTFSTERLTQALADPSVRASLGRYRLGSVKELELFLSRNLRAVPPPPKLHGKLNTDDNVWLEYALPWDMFHGDRAYARDFPLAAPSPRPPQR